MQAKAIGRCYNDAAQHSETQWLKEMRKLYFLLNSVDVVCTFDEEAEMMACKEGALEVCLSKLALLALRPSRSLEVRLGGGNSESLMIPPLFDMVQSPCFLAKE